MLHSSFLMRDQYFDASYDEALALDGLGPHDHSRKQSQVIFLECPRSQHRPTMKRGSISMTQGISSVFRKHACMLDLTWRILMSSELA